MKLARAFAFAVSLLGGAAIASAASVPPLQGPLDPSNLLYYFNTLVGSINQSVPGYQPLNFLDNGSMLINQRGTAEATGSNTGGCAVTAYASDRWCIDTNVTSGAGFGRVLTSSSGVTFALGFPNMLSVYRKTGALLQPVCAWQEIETLRFQSLQGRPVILSAYLAANTSFPTGGVVTGHLVTGTGTNEGLGSLRSAVGMTASPAITPAFAGVATAAVTLTATPTATATRYSSAPMQVPAGATEGAVAFCFTPSTETAGTADGFLITGTQLEQADPNQITAGRYQRPPPADELLRAQRFFWQITDPAATVEVPSSCFVTAANTTVKCGVYLPTQMQIAPVTAISTSTSFGIVVTAGTAGTCTTLAATASSNSVNSIGVTCTTGGTIALGSATPLIGAGTAGTLNASADF